ncbi:MAG: hypothetical protein L6Q71_07975 [Planctomycetes bacterium]|nr:hypothetical protein [Planctomycetota bacterium]NUQ34150.1 hypothetical protein [Planctomycetaceae bacterium]
MKLLFQTFGWVLVLLGLLAPPGVFYLDSVRPEMVDAYRDTYEDFGSSPEQDRKRLLEDLDFMIDADVAARRAAPGMIFPPMNSGEVKP